MTSQTPPLNYLQQQEAEAVSGTAALVTAADPLTQPAVAQRVVQAAETAVRAEAPKVEARVETDAKAVAADVERFAGKLAPPLDKLVTDATDLLPSPLRATAGQTVAKAEADAPAVLTSGVRGAVLAFVGFLGTQSTLQQIGLHGGLSVAKLAIAAAVTGGVHGFVTALPPTVRRYLPSKSS